MKTTKLLIALGIMLIFSQSFAQDPTKRTNLNNAGIRAGESANHSDGNSGAISSDFKIGGTSGNPYMNSEWQEGIIIMNDNSVIKGNKFRYNIYTQQMQFTDDKDTMAIANPEEIKFVRFATNVFVYTDYLYNGELKSGYFELLKDGNGKCSLLKRRKVSYHLVDHDANQVLDPSCKSEEFVQECSCFLKFGDQPAMALENRKKDFLNCFDGESEDIAAFMKSNKMKFKDQDHLIEIVSYYNEIHQ